MSLALSALDEALLGGAHGGAAQFAMQVLVRYAEAVGAARFIDIAQAHIDGCLHHGQVSLDFVDRLVALGGAVRVPTTLNVGSIDLIHPELFLGGAAAKSDGARLMRQHVALGCRPSFTCAPYQETTRPSFGDQIAWGESNAIVFANSVIGARTERYGDFVDLCCAMTGRAPEYGLHLYENRAATVVVELRDLPDGWGSDRIAVALGHRLGATLGRRIAAVVGLPADTSEDDLKALGAVAASAGAVAMFHAVGLTPEAPDLAAALQGRAPDETLVWTSADLRDALARLSTVPEGARLGAISLGTPHFSDTEFSRLMPLLDGFSPAPGVDLYVNTARATHAVLEADGRLARLEAAGFTVVVDTCTYVTAVMRPVTGAVMTNSGKWAHYAPGNLGIEVAFGSLADCIASAAAGRVVRAP